MALEIRIIEEKGTVCIHGIFVRMVLVHDRALFLISKTE